MPRSSILRAFTMGVMAFALMVLAGCGTSTMDTLNPQSDLTREIHEIYGLIFWIDTILFIIVQGALIYAVVKFRARGDEKGLPEQVHGNLTLELGWTIAPVFILMIIAIPTVVLIFESQAEAKEDALIINAGGEQWWFSFAYPQHGFVTANEVHVPLGREVEVRLQSDNVIHAFWVPQVAAKRDMMPGRVNRIKFTAEKIGMFLGQCAEYCQDSHALMKFRMFVDSPEDFAAWTEWQKAPVPEAEATAEGFQLFQNATCVACHAISGTTAASDIGPNLSHYASRTTMAAGIMENNEANLRKWLKDPTAVKPGSKMPNLNLSDEQINGLVTYLQSLK